MEIASPVSAELTKYHLSRNNSIIMNKVSGSGKDDLCDDSALLPIDNRWQDNKYDSSNWELAD